MTSFENLQVGDCAFIKRVVSEDDLDCFVQLIGDDNPIHVDASFAESLGFDGRVVHGMLTTAFISTLIGTQLPGRGTLWYEVSLRFLSPVYIGEELTIEGTIKKKSPASRAVIIAILITTATGKKVVEGDAKVKVPFEEDGSVKQSLKAAGAVVVTGGTGGIGAAICIALAAEGYNVVVNTRKKSNKASELINAIESSGGRGIIAEADIATDEGIDSLVQIALDAGLPLYGLVNNASPEIEVKGLTDLDWEDIQKQISVQVRGPFLLAKRLLPIMADNGGGRVVSITTVAIENVPPPNVLAYCIAKTGLETLTRSIAVEFGPKGITANCVAPGMTSTGLSKKLSDKARMLAKVQAADRRLAEAEEIAAAVRFLLSSNARHITGQTLRVCGGTVMA